jgi:N-hydroxyarylamine O-acetyltransferase
VVWGLAETDVAPRSHTLTLVEIDGQQWIADVGFGVVTLTAPLRLDVRDAQETPHERFRIEDTEQEDYLLRAELGTKWAPVYRFELTPQFAVDYVVANFYVNTHPESIFVNNLLAARAVPGARYSLFNGEFNSYTPELTRRKLADVAEVRTVLQDVFAIRLPDADARLDEALARCIAK